MERPELSSYQSVQVSPSQKFLDDLTAKMISAEAFECASQKLSHVLSQT